MTATASAKQKTALGIAPFSLKDAPTLDTVAEIKVVCNGDLDPFDVKVAKAARDGQKALARTLVSNWQSTEDGLDLLLAREHYRRLHDLLASGRIRSRQGRGDRTF